MTDELQSLKRHIGQSETDLDVVTASAIARMAATLGVATPASEPGDPIPPGWHTAFFPPTHRTDQMRADGQAAGGGIMPKVPLPRRRLKGESLRLFAPLGIGDQIERVTEIADIEVNEAGEGPPMALKLRHTVSGPGGKAVVEERNFIYLGEGQDDVDAEPPPGPPQAAWQKEIVPDLVLLFRFSAVRFNSHRIHYDRDYTTGVEGCPGLVVQSTLVSQLLLEMCRAEMPGATVAGFDYRTLHPIYDTGPFTIAGAPAADGGSVALWALDADGALAMEGTVTLAG